MDHPGVIKIFDHSRADDDVQFYVMEYAEGAESLKKLMDENINPFANYPRKAIEFAINLFDAMVAWNEKGIIHRDLSPANILVLPDLSIKVIDFGICQIENGKTITLTREGLGTRYYASS